MAYKNEHDIQRNEQIGEGGFGTVYIGSYREHLEVAVKDIKGELSKEALAEAKVLKKLVHPNIIRYIDIVQTEKQTSIIMEFVDGGSLYQYILKTPRSVTYWKYTWQIMIDVAYGMAYLHGQRIVHADLKSLNILLRHNHSAVICDFGLARTIADSKVTTTNHMAGTVQWFAPELCLSQPEKSSFQSDVWAFGCVLLEVISKKIPWYDVYNNPIILVVALGNPENASIFKNICLSQNAPEKLIALLCRCCSWKKADRPQFPTIVQDLSSISDVDIQNVIKREDTSFSANASDATPSTSKGRSQKKDSSLSSTKTNSDNLAESNISTSESKSRRRRKDLSTDPKNEPHTDIRNMNQEGKKIVKSNPSDRIPSNSHKERKPKFASASQATDDDVYDFTKPSSLSTVIFTPLFQYEDMPENSEKTKYDITNGRKLYQGARGGWYYINSNGKKVYTTDN